MSASLFLLDAWTPERLQDTKNSFCFADETYFHRFVKALNIAKFSNQMSAILINTETRTVVKEHIFPCGNCQSECSLFDLEIPVEEKDDNDFRQHFSSEYK